ncbi:hypothetical protein BC832DRAFT_529073 [Gaertneriomyces semiglobifer]|nr:hypothetical protein BC832DRAFT_529073 [Gaertneriomyces semiglobifer]
MVTQDTLKVGDAPPTKTTRAKCWAARDTYFACLDDHNLWLQGLRPQTHEEIIALDAKRPIIRSESDRSLTKKEREDLYICRKMKEMFDQSCLPSWVNHFSLLRVKDLQTKYLREKLEKDEKEREAAGSGFWEKVQAKPASA